jgi:hypothetical protein
MFTVACWVTMALSCAAARPQDSSSVPATNSGDASAVDASVHAEVEDGARQQPQSSLGPYKRSTSYSQWGFSSASRFGAAQSRFGQPTSASRLPATGQTPSTVGSPSVPAEIQTLDHGLSPTRTTNSAITPAAGGYSRSADRQSNLFGGLSADRLHARPTGGRLLETQAQSPAPQLEPPALSTSLRRNQFGGASASSFPNPFPRATYSSGQDRPKTKQHKTLPLKPGERMHPDTSARSSHYGKRSTSQLTAKPE